MNTQHDKTNNKEEEEGKRTRDAMLNSRVEIEIYMKSHVYLKLQAGVFTKGKSICSSLDSH